MLKFLFFFLFFVINSCRKYVLIPKSEQIVEKKLKTKLPIPLNELEKTVNLALINSHPSFDFPQPLVPNVIDVAGLHIKEPAPLSRVMLV